MLEMIDQLLAKFNIVAEDLGFCWIYVYEISVLACAVYAFMRYLFCFDRSTVQTLLFYGLGWVVSL
jgi:hypothetical protein